MPSGNRMVSAATRAHAGACSKAALSSRKPGWKRGSRPPFERLALDVEITPSIGQTHGKGIGCRRHKGIA